MYIASRDALEDKSPRIVTFVNAAYVPIAWNWLAAMDRLGLRRQCLVVTLDAQAHASLQSADVATLYRPLHSQDFKDLWPHRTEVIADLLADGRDVVHSDVDAIWLRDPLPHLRDDGEDMVFSQGTLWPPESHRRRGFVLCCGFFLLRAVPVVQDFVVQLRERASALGDDQWALNQLIDERVTGWSVDEPYELTYRDTAFVCSRSKMRAHSPSLKVSVVPHHAFPRLVTTLDEVVVAHPLSGKSLEETRSVLIEKGLWFL